MKHIIILILLVIFIVGCEKAAEEDEVVTGVKEFDMTAKQFQFEPNKIVVNKGDNVIISIRSLDVAHGFAIDDYGIKERIEPGETIEINFIANKAGLFSFYSWVDSGPGYGAMRGQFIVIEE